MKSELSKWTGFLMASALIALATVVVACCKSKAERQPFGLSLRGASVAVYPAVVRQVTGLTCDPDAAERIAQCLRTQAGSRATAASEQVPLPLEPKMIQQRQYLSSRDAFSQFVAARSSNPDYSILAEYLITPLPSGGQRAGGIHLYVVDAHGNAVPGAGFLLNDHHPLFAQAKPATSTQCTDTLLAALQDRWALTEPSTPTAARCSDATAPAPQAKIRIGVYDSRAIVVAFAPTQMHRQWLESLRAQRDQAKAAGDMQKVKTIEQQGQAHQVKFHNQGFGTAPVDDILAKVPDALPSAAREANVGLIVSKWRLDYCSAEVEQVDVTNLLVAKFNPSPKTLKIIADLRQRPPVSDEALAKLGPLD